MFDLLRMDLRRMAKAKAFWVTLIIFCGVILLLCITMTITADAELVTRLASWGGTVTINGQAITDAGQAQAELIAEAAEARAELQSMSKPQFFYSLFCQGGGLSVFIAILCTLFVCADFSSGFAKNIFSVRRRGPSYLLAKAVTMICTTGVFILLCTVLCQVCFAVLRMPLQPGTLPEYAKYLLQAWVAISAFAIQNVFFCVWLRSVGLGMVLSFVCAGGVAAMAIESLTRLFGLNLTPFLLFGATATNGLTLGGLAACVVWSAVYLLLGTVILRRKDI